MRGKPRVGLAVILSEVEDPRSEIIDPRNEVRGTEGAIGTKNLADTLRRLTP